MEAKLGLLCSSFSMPWAGLLSLLLHLTQVPTQDLDMNPSKDSLPLPFHLSLSHSAVNQDKRFCSMMIIALKKNLNPF